uniref:ATP synthase F0 subunit 8 n=1 Tax=Palaemon adspersus TaxID=1169710 RepID=UPI0016192097|nr:ATP synthase F0 subunit 8 [Palaemon adspersus]QLM01570.1 ATP synthase F0 subunit 8 [Palaemon adspersus]
MPQMAPLLWLNLYIFFTIMFAIIVIMNFYMKPPIKVNVPTKLSSLNPQTWKW